MTDIEMKDSKLVEEKKVDKTTPEEPTDQFYGKLTLPSTNKKFYRDEEVSRTS